MKSVTQVLQYGDHTLKLETGEIARQATGAVMASLGDTVVMVTAVGRQEDEGTRDFFPLTVNYQERTYAAGKIPGGFFRREGRPSEKETLSSRLIDRPLRPLFPKGFAHEVQIIATVVSLDKEIDPDIPAIIGASVAATTAASTVSPGSTNPARQEYIPSGQPGERPRSVRLPSVISMITTGSVRGSWQAAMAMASTCCR